MSAIYTNIITINAYYEIVNDEREPRTKYFYLYKQIIIIISIFTISYVLIKLILFKENNSDFIICIYLFKLELFYKVVQYSLF